MQLTENQITVAKVIYANPGINRTELSKLTSIREQALDPLIRRELVTETRGILGLSEELRERIASLMPKGQIAAPRTHEFKPLSPKHIPSLEGRREGCERREITFKTMTSNIPGAARSYV